MVPSAFASALGALHATVQIYFGRQRADEAADALLERCDGRYTASHTELAAWLEEMGVLCVPGVAGPLQAWHEVYLAVLQGRVGLLEIWPEGLPSRRRWMVVMPCEDHDFHAAEALEAEERRSSRALEQEDLTGRYILCNRSAPWDYVVHARLHRDSSSIH